MALRPSQPEVKYDAGPERIAKGTGSTKDTSRTMTGLEIVGAGLAVGGFAASLFGGSGKSESGYTLPPEYELQFFDDFEKQMKQIDETYTRMNMAYEAYVAKSQALDSILAGGPNAEGLQALTASNFRIMSSLGLSAEELVSNGFMTPEDATLLKRQEELLAGDGRVDPVQEQQLKDQRERLAQDLRRSGQSEAMIQQELNRFDIAAREAKWTRGQELAGIEFGRITNILANRTDLRQTNYNMATGTLNQGLGMAATAFSALYGSNAQRFEAAGSLAATQQSLRQEGMSNYEQMGKIKFSNTAKDALEAGLKGPGSVYEQTGIRRNDMGTYKNIIKRRENAAFASGSTRVNRDVTAADLKNQRDTDFWSNVNKRPKNIFDEQA